MRNAVVRLCRVSGVLIVWSEMSGNIYNKIVRILVGKHENGVRNFLNPISNLEEVGFLEPFGEHAGALI